MEFKHEKDRKLFFELAPILQFILMDVNLWCSKRGLPFVITETVTTVEIDDKYKRVSKSHADKRATDSSVKGWTIQDIKDLQEEFNEKYKDVSAISAKSFKPVLIVHHNSGYGDHLHFQVHKKFTVK